MNENNISTAYFIQMMQSVINSTDIQSPPEDVDWQFIYEFAIKHSLGGMLYYAIQKLAEEHRPCCDFMPYLRQMYQEQIVADLNLSVETERILNRLSAENIKCMPFKGIVTKNDYPQTFLRTMSDVDILCDSSMRSQAEKVLLSEGYAVESVGEKDTSFRKDEIFHFEMHSFLLNNSSPGYEYFSSVWDRAVYNDNGMIAHMCIEDTYIFMLEHLADHLFFGGAGLRMYMDIYLFLMHHSDSLNWSYTNKVLADICLDDFERSTRKLCFNWFSGEEIVDVSSVNSDFVLSSGTFGRPWVPFLSDTLRNQNDGSSSFKNGFNRIMSKLFPSVKWMRLKYTAVDRIPVLYPLFVPVYWIDRAFIKKNVNTKNISDYFVSADSDEAKELRSVYVSLGLEKRL